MDYQPQNRYSKEAIAQAINELQLELKERPYSQWWYGFCPLHENVNSPALAVNVDTGGWKCWAGCGDSDDIARLINLVTGEQLKSIQRRLYKLVPENLMESLSNIFFKPENLDLDRKTEPLFYDRSRAPQYLLDRGFNMKTLKKWKIGWDLDLKAVVIPIYVDCKLTGLIRRIVNPIDGEPKYRYTLNLRRSDILFGIEHIPFDAQRVSLVEGALDAIWLNMHGIPAVAVLGSSISKMQADIISKRFTEVVLAFDNDKAGLAAETVAVEALNKLRLYRVILPDGVKDVQELNSKQLISLFTDPPEIWYY